MASARASTLFDPEVERTERNVLDHRGAEELIVGVLKQQPHLRRTAAAFCAFTSRPSIHTLGTRLPFLPGEPNP